MKNLLLTASALLILISSPAWAFVDAGCNAPQHPSDDDSVEVLLPGSGLSPSARYFDNGETLVNTDELDDCFFKNGDSEAAGPVFAGR
ncbi:MAG: hypothetical protein SOW06_09995 [Succinivibrionaceae bacterium]|jgi:hypothetical protein|nr:hypothetical protein [Pseudomonadota bacterium]MDY3145683.1 hypothetical protein [Succinivibrionaceae bacterium]MDD6546531.1 hypothetical protein [Pseudomonadota bacterium]MDY6274733.1 hypothetical protein [Succinivibrionaceae bacterium]MDY6337035.1 hypothetical protein [Succinivibrionaceae bacterium]